MILSLITLAAAILLCIWAVMSFLIIVLLLKNSGLSMLAFLSVVLYAVFSATVIVFVATQIGPDGLSALVPLFFSAY